MPRQTRESDLNCDFRFEFFLESLLVRHISCQNQNAPLSSAIDVRTGNVLEPTPVALLVLRTVLQWTRCPPFNISS